MTQRDRVLEMLVAAGDKGVHTFEMRRAFIGNPSQRIAEIEELGYPVTRTRERLNGEAVGTRYVLVRQPDVRPEPVSPPPSPPGGTGLGQLFDTTDQEFDSIVPPLSPYDTEKAA